MTHSEIKRLIEKRQEQLIRAPGGAAEAAILMELVRLRQALEVERE